MIRLSETITGGILVAYLGIGQALAQAGPAKLVPMPDDIGCDAAINAKTSADNKGNIAIHDGTIKKLACKIVGGKIKEIALKTTAIKSGIVQTADFGEISASAYISVPKGGVTNPSQIVAKMRYLIDEGKVASLRAFLRAP